MMVLSPRSYVTGAFDILFPTLLKHIYNTLSAKRKHDWWISYVVVNMTDIKCKDTKQRIENSNLILGLLSYTRFLSAKYLITSSGGTGLPFSSKTVICKSPPNLCAFSSPSYSSVYIKSGSF